MQVLRVFSSDYLYSSWPALHSYIYLITNTQINKDSQAKTSYNTNKNNKTSIKIDVYTDWYFHKFLITFRILFFEPLASIVCFFEFSKVLMSTQQSYFSPLSCLFYSTRYIVPPLSHSCVYWSIFLPIQVHPIIFGIFFSLRVICLSPAT